LCQNHGNQYFISTHPTNRGCPNSAQSTLRDTFEWIYARMWCSIKHNKCTERNLIWKMKFKPTHISKSYTNGKALPCCPWGFFYTRSGPLVEDSIDRLSWALLSSKYTPWSRVSGFFTLQQ
jgi:hypothetical protein